MKKNNLIKLIPIISIASAALNFSQFYQTYAKEDSTTGLVRCHGLNCSFCDLISLVSRLFNTAYELAIAIATVLLLVGAIQIMISGAKPGLLEKGKKTITGSVIGLVILFASWIIIDTVIKILTGGAAFGPWNALPPC